MSKVSSHAYDLLATDRIRVNGEIVGSAAGTLRRTCAWAFSRRASIVFDGSRKWANENFMPH